MKCARCGSTAHCWNCEVCGEAMCRWCSFDGLCVLCNAVAKAFERELHDLRIDFIRDRTTTTKPIGFIKEDL